MCICLCLSTGVIFIKLNNTFSSLIVPLEVPLSSLENLAAASPSCDDK